MPYDDSNIKKMIKDQLERRVGFSRSKVVSPEAKDLIRHILEVNVNRRYTLPQILAHPWITAGPLDSNIPGPSGNDNANQTPYSPEPQSEQLAMTAACTVNGKSGDSVPHKQGSPSEKHGEHEEKQNDETVVAMA